MKSDSEHKTVITIFSGGVGGAKLARGFAAAFGHEDVRIIVNTADDAVLHGLTVCPDVDTVMYHLCGEYNPDQGWGLRDESFHTLDQLGRLGQDTWFRLGDRDLATHIIRSRMLREGASLTYVTRYLSKQMGIKADILPMSDDSVSTMIISGEQTLPFQEYFVKLRCQVEVDAVRFQGLAKAKATPQVMQAIEQADLIIFAPSNPIVSILPIISLNGVRDKISASPACKMAVSPLIAGKALKGPAVQLMQSLDYQAGLEGLADFYEGLIDHLFIQPSDREEASKIVGYGLKAVSQNIIMPDLEASARLARALFGYFRQLRGNRHEDSVHNAG